MGAIVEAIENEIACERVSVHVEGDRRGLVAAIDPAERTGLVPGRTKE